MTEGHEEAAEAVTEDELEELGGTARVPDAEKEAPMSVWTRINQEFRYSRRYQPSREERYLEERYPERGR